MTHKDNELEELPDTLIEALKSADEAMPLITARVDREVVKMAREQFAERKPAWRRPAWAAIAATVFLAVVIGQPQFQRSSMPVMSPRPPDISDVLKLARERAGESGAQAEIDALALQVVSLTPREES